MFEKMTRVPDPGSPMELMFLLVWKMRQNIEFQKSRSVLQALLNQKGSEPKEIEKAFEDLKEAFFPFDKNQKGDEIRRLREALFKEISRGPVQLTPMVEIGAEKNAGKLARGQRVTQQRAAERQSGKTVDLDSFQRAKRRPRHVS